MKRKTIKNIVIEIASEYESKTYEDLLAMQYPIVFERMFDGRIIQAEINRLTVMDDYIQLGIAVSGDWLSGYIPVGYSCVIHRKEDKELS